MLRAVGRLWRVKKSMAQEYKVSLASWPLEILAEQFHQDFGEWNCLINLYKSQHLWYTYNLNYTCLLHINYVLQNDWIYHSFYFSTMSAC